MNRALRHGLILSVLVTNGFQWPGSQFRADSAAPGVTMSVRIHNYVELPKGILTEAKKEAARIFREAGVETVWADAPVSVGKQPGTAMKVSSTQNRPLELRILILPPSMAKRLHPRKNVLAHALGLSRRVYLFYERVEARARVLQSMSSQSSAMGRWRYNHFLAKILGRVMAHELGHLLLPEHSHSPGGIMSAFWNLKRVEHPDQGDLVFTEKQTQLIRANLSARVKAEAREF